jgi:RHS repeat-associated protein
VVDSVPARRQPDAGTTTYSFDAGRRLSSLVNPLSERTTWQYDPVGRITTLTHANATRAVHSYNAAGWVTGLVNAKSDGTTLTSHDYSYDALGSPTSMVDSGGDRTTWTYDALSRLTRERRSGANAYDLTYTYDPVGNRATKLTGGVTTTYTYDAADELTAANAGGTRTTFTYDNDGNALSQNAAGTWTTMTWGYEDELKTIQSGGATATMTYDADFMRRKRQEGAATANYLWDGAQVLAETDGSNATVARYTLAPFGFGDLVAQRRSAATRWYHFDALGSTRALTDSGAAVTDTALYQAFGTQVASSGSTVNPHSWVGRLGYGTEARLSGYLLRRRYYADGVGRFLSRDPLGLGPGRTYAYVGQRATRGVDPAGLFPPGGPVWKAQVPQELRCGGLSSMGNGSDRGVDPSGLAALNDVWGDIGDWWTRYFRPEVVVRWGLFHSHEAGVGACYAGCHKWTWQVVRDCTGFTVELSAQATLFCMHVDVGNWSVRVQPLKCPPDLPMYNDWKETTEISLPIVSQPGVTIIDEPVGATMCFSFGFGISSPLTIMRCKTQLNNLQQVY